MSTDAVVTGISKNAQKALKKLLKIKGNKNLKQNKFFSLFFVDKHFKMLKIIFSKYHSVIYIY